MATRDSRGATLNASSAMDRPRHSAKAQRLRSSVCSGSDARQVIFLISDPSRRSLGTSLNSAGHPHSYSVQAVSAEA
eukprot:7216885-Prymnesium_polylepis.1